MHAWPCRWLRAHRCPGSLPLPVVHSAVCKAVKPARGASATTDPEPPGLRAAARLAPRPHHSRSPHRGPTAPKCASSRALRSRSADRRWLHPPPPPLATTLNSACRHDHLHVAAKSFAATSPHPAAAPPLELRSRLQPSSAIALVPTVASPVRLSKVGVLPQLDCVDRAMYLLWLRNREGIACLNCAACCEPSSGPLRPTPAVLRRACE